jgi:hypothetical protein
MAKKPNKRPRRKLPRARQLRVKLVVDRHKKPVVAVVPVEHVGPLLKLWREIVKFFGDIEQAPMDLNRRN